jgi:hypothetical protein
MNEFSDVGSEVQSTNNLRMLKAISNHLNYQISNEKGSSLNDTPVDTRGERPSGASL